MMKHVWDSLSDLKWDKHPQKCATVNKLDFNLINPRLSSQYIPIDWNVPDGVENTVSHGVISCNIKKENRFVL